MFVSKFQTSHLSFNTTIIIITSRDLRLNYSHPRGDRGGWLCVSLSIQPSKNSMEILKCIRKDKENTAQRKFGFFTFTHGYGWFGNNFGLIKGEFLNCSLHFVCLFRRRLLCNEYERQKGIMKWCDLYSIHNVSHSKNYHLICLLLLSIVERAIRSF